MTVRSASREDDDGNFFEPEKRNRPVLLWPDGSTISMTDAQTKLGFTFFEVYASTLKINARAVENALQVPHCTSLPPCPTAPPSPPHCTSLPAPLHLQARYQRHLPLGQRLWRSVDKGSKYDKEVDGKLHKVFITFSPLAGQMLAEGKIKVNF